MLKIQHIDLILDYLSGGDAPASVRGRYHKKIIEKHIEVVYNAIIAEETKKAAITKSWSDLDAFTKAYEVDVNYENGREEYYSNLPAKVMQLSKNRGVRKIYPKKDQRYSFIYRNNNTIDIFSELEVDKIEERPRYYIESQKVYYDYIGPEMAAEGVGMKLVVPFSEFDDNDEVALPNGKDNLIFDMVIARLIQKTEETKFNDNNIDKQTA